MSVDRFEWLAAVFSENGPASHAERSILGVLSTYLSRNRQVAWPSQKVIALRARISVRQTKRLLSKLRTDGWIESEQVSSGTTHGWRHCRYRPSIPTVHGPERGAAIPTPRQTSKANSDGVERGVAILAPRQTDNVVPFDAQRGAISDHNVVPSGHDVVPFERNVVPSGSHSIPPSESSNGIHQEFTIGGEGERTSRAPAAGELPLNWQPAAATRAEMKQERPDVDLDAELPQFRDYYQSRGTTRANWDAAFRTWVRRAKKPRNGNVAGHRARTAAELAEEEAAFEAFAKTLTAEEMSEAHADAKRIGFRARLPNESAARYIFCINDALEAIDEAAFRNVGIDRSPSFRPIEELIPDRKLRAKLIEKRTAQIRRDQRRVVV